MPKVNVAPPYTTWGRSAPGPLVEAAKLGLYTVPPIVVLRAESDFKGLRQFIGTTSATTNLETGYAPGVIAQHR